MSSDGQDSLKLLSSKGGPLIRFRIAVNRHDPSRWSAILNVTKKLPAPQRY
jgi:hypothetical protein